MITVITLEQSAVPPVGEQLGGFRSVATSPQHGVQACQARPKKEDEPLFNSDRSSLPRMLNHPKRWNTQLGVYCRACLPPDLHCQLLWVSDQASTGTRQCVRIVRQRLSCGMLNRTRCAQNISRPRANKHRYETLARSSIQIRAQPHSSQHSYPEGESSLGNAPWQNGASCCLASRTLASKAVSWS